MENNSNTKNADPTKSHDRMAPEDPSNTSHIGQKVEREIISKTEGITERSSNVEDEEDEKTAQYIKHPSPEDRG
ncbi:MAG: hypothetical protein LH478_00555 [Chitinophagaceae bacterium]|nr:hypothetical protein [Chitinophagaceae bacterium]